MKTTQESFLLVFSIILLCARTTTATLHVDTSYGGIFRGNQTFEKLTADLPFVYQESLQKINRSLGIPIPENIEIVVIFSDQLTHNGLRLRGKRRSESHADGRIVHYIYLDLEFLMKGQATLIEEMTHEMTHSVMAEKMGLGRYEKLPMWLKEGAAVHSADQGLARIKALMRRGFNLSQIGNEDESDDGNPISLERYVENYLKVQFLLKTYGAEALHIFLRRVMESGNIKRELLSSFNGLSEEVMTRYARDYVAQTLIANARPLKAHEQMARGMRFFDEGEYLSARLALTDALYGGLSDQEFQKAAYLLAECYIQERNPESAFSALQKIKPDPKNIPIDRYKFLSAYTQYAMGLCTQAYFGFKQAFESSNNPAVQEGALYYIIRILLELENRDEAVKILNFMKSKFPKSAYIPLAKAVFSSRR